MPKIPSLPPLDAPDLVDLLPIEDTSTATTKSVSLSVLSEWLKNILASSGEVKMTARAAAPTGWLICDGTAVSRSTYSTLFTEIGIAYGAGNGTTTFNLPDFRDRLPMGKSATKALGTTGGASTVNLSHAHGTTSHSHVLTSYNTAGGRSSAGATGFQSSGGALDLVAGSGGSTFSLANSSTNSASPATDSQLSASQSILNPYQAINFIIKT